MSESAEFVLNEVVGDVLSAAIVADGITPVPVTLPVNEETDTEKRKRPCLLVESTEGDVLHPRLVERELRLEFLIQRDDTEAVDVSRWVEALRKWLVVAAHLQLVLDGLQERGWQVRTWTQQGEIGDEDEKRGWKSGLIFKVVLMEV